MCTWNRWESGLYACDVWNEYGIQTQNKSFFYSKNRTQRCLEWNNALSLDSYFSFLKAIFGVLFMWKYFPYVRFQSTRTKKKKKIFSGFLFIRGIFINILLLRKKKKIDMISFSIVLKVFHLTNFAKAEQCINKIGWEWLDSNERMDETYYK